VAVVSAVDAPVFGQNVVFTATVSGPLTPTGTVIFYLDGTAQPPVTLSSGTATFSPADILSMGSHTLKASFGGSVNYTGSDSALFTFVVGKANTTLNLTSDTNPATRGQSVTFIAQLAANSPGGGTPDGSVTFQLDGVAVGSPVNLDGSGVATLSLSTLSAGSHTLVATYSGSSSYTQSQNQLTQVVNNPPLNLALQNATGAFGASTTLSATLTYNGTPLSAKSVSFSLNGSNVGSANTNAQGVARLTLSLTGLEPGIYPLLVSFGGDSIYPVGSDSATLSVTKLNATLTLGNLSQTYDGTPKFVTYTTYSGQFERGHHLHPGDKRGN
jgi:hypothetical protein